MKKLLNNILFHLFFTTSFAFVAYAQSPNKTVLKENPWVLMKQIVDDIAMPIFPSNEYNVTEFGAIGNGVFDNSIALNKAIETCNNNGGGKVIVPAGKFLTGAIHLKSNVNLHLNDGAEILFSTNPNDYYPLVITSFEGTELINYSPLIYAFRQKNIAVTGNGILNGQASEENWWTWKGKVENGWKNGMPSQLDSLNIPQLLKMAQDNIPVKDRVFGNGHYLRPSFFEPFECENVMIQGVKIINAPMWVLHPIKCVNVIIDGVHVESHGPNNDGCDPEYSKNVIIKNCTFNTGDDCIAIKSGRNYDGRRINIPSENIVIQNCKMVDGHGGIVIGSEISAGVKNVFVENCYMDSPNLERAIRIKTNSYRGGIIENVYVRNITIGEVKESVVRINMFYEISENDFGGFNPQIKNIYLENIKVKNGGKYGLLAKGIEASPIANVVLKNVVIEQTKEPYSIKNVKNIQFLNTHINGMLIKDLK